MCLDLLLHHPSLCPPLCLCPQPFLGGRLSSSLGPNLIQYDLISVNYVCKDPTSKEGHILMF